MIANTKLSDLPTLRGQALCILGLFFVSLAIAALVAGNASWFEAKRSGVQWRELPSVMLPVAALVNEAKFSSTELDGLSEERVALLLDHWMRGQYSNPRIAAANLLGARPQFCVQRAEATLACGTKGQRDRILDFLGNGSPSLVTPPLERALRWSNRRGDRELSQKIGSILSRINNVPRKGESAK